MNLSKVIKIVILIGLPLNFLISIPLHGDLLSYLAPLLFPKISAGFGGIILYYVTEAILFLTVILIDVLLAYIFFKKHK